MLIVDTGVLLAAADLADPHHERCAALIDAEPDRLVTTPMVIAEACYLIDRQLGPEAEALFVQSVANGDLEVEQLAGADWQRIATLIRRYASLPLGGTDASVVAVAERLKVQRVATLDHRHFRVVRPDSLGFFELLP